MKNQRVEHRALRELAETHRGLVKALPSPETSFIKACVDWVRKFPGLEFWRYEFAYVVARWRFSKGIYRFERSIEEAILSSMAKTIPSQVLDYLPKPAAYVETKTIPDLDGFFFTRACLNRESKEEALMFALAWNQGGEERADSHAIPLIGSSFEECFEEAENIGMSREEKKRMKQLFPRLLNLLLYLCSRNADMPNLPQKPAPKKTKKGLRYFTPAQAKTWDVGFRIGPKLRRHARAQAGAESTTTGRRKRPHFSTSYFSIKWTGKGREVPRLVWNIHSFKGFKGSGILPGEQPAVQRDVPPNE